MRLLSVLGFLFLGMVGFGQTLVEIPSAHIFKEDLVYKIVGKDSLKLDFHAPLPENEGLRFPLVIYFHGGSWKGGDKTLEEPYFRNTLKKEALAQGYAVVSANYRFIDTVNAHFPNPILDAKDVLRWVHKHAEEYGIDVQNIGLIGESSGAHLALLSAYSTDDMWEDDEQLRGQSTKVNYVVNHCGPTDLNKLLRTNLGALEMAIAKLFVPKEVLFMRNAIIKGISGLPMKNYKKEVQEALKRYSPITYAKEFAVPTLSFQGEKDKAVPKNQSKRLNKALSAAGVPTEVVLVEDSEHVYHNLDEAAIDEIIVKTLDFMKLHLK